MAKDSEHTIVARNSTTAAALQGSKLAEPNLAALNIMHLAEVFPDCVSRVEIAHGDSAPKLQVDVPRLMACLGLDWGTEQRWEQSTTVPELGVARSSSVSLNVSAERYELNWPGKLEARLRALSPVHKTVVADRGRSVNFDHTANLFFEGDNLDALKLMQLSFFGAIKVIYIDPPYNTGNDALVYHDTFKQTEEQAAALGLSQVDVDGNRVVGQIKGSARSAGLQKGEVRLGDNLVLSVNQGSDGRLHSNWCSMMYERMLLARPLLSPDGAIFVSIDDREVTNLRKIMDEVFGESNFVITFVWKKKQGGGNDSGLVVNDHEYVLVYAKDISKVDLGLDFGAAPNYKDYPLVDENGHYSLITLDKSSIQFSPSLCFEIIGPDGTSYRPRVIKGKQSCWRWGKDKVAQHYNELVFKDGNVYTKNYLKQAVKPRSLLIDAERFGRTNRGKSDLQDLFTNCPFSYPKPVRLISYLISLMQGKDFTVLDFFGGSGTTAQAVMECNLKDGGHRRFIMVQLPEPLAEDVALPAIDAVQERSSGAHTLTTLSDLAIERISRAAAKVDELLMHQNSALGGGRAPKKCRNGGRYEVC